MKAARDFAWGVWLKDEREWATLPPRLRKPTPWNSDLVPALIDVLRESVAQGHDPELKCIPAHELRAMRDQIKGLTDDRQPLSADEQGTPNLPRTLA